MPEIASLWPRGTLPLNDAGSYDLSRRMTLAGDPGA